ncbi:MAG: hypothetical protein AABY13_01080 [Nanoarchaeota archaeon]
MQSKPRFVDYALKGIRENPEVFDALLAFERTKRVPKTTYKRRVDITVDETILREFKALCAKQDVPLSRAVERLMLGILRTSKRSTSQ